MELARCYHLPIMKSDAMNTVHLHLERLRRHYEVAVHTYDHVSLLDLSHALRNWVELKQALKTIAPKFSTALAFKTAIPAKKIFKVVRGHQFVIAYMPGGVPQLLGGGAG